MSDKQTFVIQAFAMKRGRLVPGQKDVAPTANGAIKRAEALASRVHGTAALAIVADEETGEVLSVAILGQWGQVPDDFRDSLLGG